MPNDLEHERKPLKGVLLVGPELSIRDYELTLAGKEDYLIVGDGIHPLNEDVVLHTLKGRIDENTRVCIHAHGDRYEADSGYQHSMDLIYSYNRLAELSNSEIFRILGEASGGKPVHIDLLSCYGGTAARDVEHLPQGSMVVCHAPEDSLVYGAGIFHNYLVRKEDNFMEQITSDLLKDGTQFMSVGIKLKDDSVAKFTLRPPAHTILSRDNIERYLRYQCKEAYDILKDLQKQQLLPDNLDIGEICYEPKFTDEEIKQYQKKYFKFQRKIGREEFFEFLKNNEEIEYDKGALLHMALKDYRDSGNIKRIEAMKQLGIDYIKDFINAIINKGDGELLLRLAKENSSILSYLQSNKDIVDYAASIGQFTIAELLIEECGCLPKSNNIYENLASIRYSDSQRFILLTSEQAQTRIDIDSDSIISMRTLISLDIEKIKILLSDISHDKLKEYSSRIRVEDIKSIDSLKLKALLSEEAKCLYRVVLRNAFFSMNTKALLKGASTDLDVYRNIMKYTSRHFYKEELSQEIIDKLDIDKVKLLCSNLVRECCLISGVKLSEIAELDPEKIKALTSPQALKDYCEGRKNMKDLINSNKQATNIQRAFRGFKGRKAAEEMRRKQEGGRAR